MEFLKNLANNIGNNVNKCIIKKSGLSFFNNLTNGIIDTKMIIKYENLLLQKPFWVDS